MFKSARHQWILLGFISQALSWETYLALWVSIALWVGCIWFRSRGLTWKIHSNGEALALLTGCFIGYVVAEALGESPHFFIGHGITAIQVTRLMRPLNRREKIFSTLAALVQVGVACVVILDSRFFWIFLASLYLLPRTLMELEHERRSDLWKRESDLDSNNKGQTPDQVSTDIQENPVDASAADNPWVHARPEPTLALKGAYLIQPRSYLWIAVITLVFFFTFPRGFLGSPIRTHRFQNNRVGSLADSIMDPTTTPSSLSRKTLLQLEGENVGYLRSFAFVNFDGVQWSRSAEYPKVRVPDPDPEEMEKLSLSGEYLSRRVRVKNVEYLGNMLPTDGQVVRLEGAFFRGPRMNAHRAIECSRIWNASRNVYEYWIRKTPEVQLWESQRLRPYLQAPRPSEPVRAWLSQRMEGLSSPLEKTRYLAQYFQDNFTYELGAPKLSRLNPTEDFLLNQKRGHCERFASALAYLLRLEGIPTRVAVGYAPSAKNWWSGWYDIRFEDAHAWTEVYIDGQGWMEFDATPRSTMPVTTRIFSDILDALDVAWYMNVVNFDGASQIAALQWSEDAARELVAWIRKAIERWWKLALLGPLTLLLGISLYYRLRRLSGKKKNNQSRKKGIWETFTGRTPIERAYLKMEKELAKRGVRRARHETPIEFARHAAVKFQNNSEEILWLAATFSALVYGKIEPSQEEEQKALGVSQRILTKQ